MQPANAVINYPLCMHMNAFITTGYSIVIVVVFITFSIFIKQLNLKCA
jgi:hypothetical protein